MSEENDLKRYYINHKDGEFSNNRLENLEWVDIHKVEVRL